jgi:hypothetical protein
MNKIHGGAKRQMGIAVRRISGGSPKAFRQKPKVIMANNERYKCQKPSVHTTNRTIGGGTQSKKLTSPKNPVFFGSGSVIAASLIFERRRPTVLLPAKG